MQFDPNEVAFGKEKLDSEEIFKFDEPVESPTASQAEEDKEPKAETKVEDKGTTETPSASDEDKESDGEQRVPYSRFKKMHDEKQTFADRVKALEAELATRQQKPEVKEEDMPEEWRLLYGESEPAKKAWEVQRKREAALREEAVKAAIDMVKKEQLAAIEAEAKKEEALDSYLSSLEESYGKKIPDALEEELLSIVDEFSPVGSDGKYVSLISPEKAIEIYNLRHSIKETKTKQAREKVVDLTNGKSQGEADTSRNTKYTPSWDSWREAL